MPVSAAPSRAAAGCWRWALITQGDLACLGLEAKSHVQLHNIGRFRCLEGTSNVSKTAKVPLSLHPSKPSRRTLGLFPLMPKKCLKDCQPHLKRSHLEQLRTSSLASSCRVSTPARWATLRLPVTGNAPPAEPVTGVKEKPKQLSQPQPPLHCREPPNKLYTWRSSLQTACLEGGLRANTSALLPSLRPWLGL